MHCSTDEVIFPISGYEWLKSFKYIAHKVFIFATMAITMLSWSADFLLTVVQGNLAMVLVKPDSELPENFMDAVNQVYAQITSVTIFIVVLALTSGHFQGTCVSHFPHGLRVAVLSQNIGFFDTLLTRVIVSPRSEHVQEVCERYTRRLMAFAPAIFQLFSGCTICFSQSSKVMLLICGTLPLSALMNYLAQRFFDRLLLIFNAPRTDVSAQTKEILKSFRRV
jgi:ABC-type multidrug transport system fused ATPase/permease subunit